MSKKHYFRGLFQSRKLPVMKNMKEMLTKKTFSSRCSEIIAPECRELIRINIRLAVGVIAILCAVSAIYNQF